MLTRVEIKPPAGINYVQNPSWAFSQLIWAAIDDSIYSIRDAAGNLRCQYVVNEGKVVFQYDFGGEQVVQLLIKSNNALT
jgi:hypothetical protein